MEEKVNAKEARTIHCKEEDFLSFKQRVINCCQVATNSLTKAEEDLLSLISCYDENIIKVNKQRVVDNDELSFLATSLQYCDYIDQIKDWLSLLEKSAKGI